MQRSYEVTKDFLNALSQLREARTARPVPEVVHGRLSSFLERAMRAADERGFNQRDVQDIGYVLAALGDEVALSLDPELRDYWLPRLLQLNYFNENVAGEGVFQRLDALLGERDRAEVLLVYFYALMFGFQGRYRLRGGEVELSNLMERVGATLHGAGLARESELAPSAARPPDARTGFRRNLPLLITAGAVFVISLVVFIGLQANVRSNADDLQGSLQTTEVD